MRSGMALIPILAFAGAIPAGADVITLAPSQDNTLYENTLGAVSNGSGQHLFLGNNSLGSTRRALLAFDVAGAIPAGATIMSVSLQVHVSQAAGGPSVATVHRVLQAWGEGASDAPMSEGQGAPAAPGDATWLHTFFDGSFWDTPGGDFDPFASGSTLLADAGTYALSSSAMAADVQAWLDAPDTNFGWMLRGDEDFLSTAKRLDSREHPDPGVRPALLVTFTPIPGPASLLPLVLPWLRSRRRRT
jgi:hypothetical protein